MCVRGGNQKIETRLDRNAVEKVENDAWKRAGERAKNSTLSSTLIWKILASLTIKVGGGVSQAVWPSPHCSEWLRVLISLSAK